MRKKELLKLLNEMALFCTDLNRLIIEYDTRAKWEALPFTSWDTSEAPYQITSYQQQVYFCHSGGTSLLGAIYEANFKITKQNSSLNAPSGIDIDEKNSLVYVADCAHVTILNLNLEILTSWKLPASSAAIYRGIKIDNTILYLTFFFLHEIYLCNSSDGKLLQKWGSELPSSKQGKFSYPYGITTDHESVIICDSFNHRIQFLKKETGMFKIQWGGIDENRTKFNYPYSILNDLDGMIYICDEKYIQIFFKDNGILYQRLGNEESGRNEICGICTVNDRLYVCDKRNNRIQIFRPKKITF